MILATNRPTDLDEAVLDRMDELLEFGLPGEVERQRIFSQHLTSYMQPMATGMFSKGTQVDMSTVDEHLMKEVAKHTKGFSGRQLAKLAASVQGAVFGSQDAALTPERLREVVKIKVKENAVREQMQDGQLHHKH